MFNVQEAVRALRGFVKQFDFNFTAEFQDPIAFFQALRASLRAVLTDQQLSTPGFKCQLRVCAEFYRRSDDRSLDANFNNKQRLVLRATDLNQTMDEIFAELWEKITNFQSLGSQWVLQRMLSCSLYISRYQPLRGSSYIPTPRALIGKRAIVNVQNKRDEHCFQWSVLAHLRRDEVADHSQRLSNYRPHLDRLNMAGIASPVTLADIGLFEQQNNMSVSVFGYEDDAILPLRLTELTDATDHVNLLLLTEGQRSHYCYIKRLDSLLFDQNKHKNRKFICPRCLLRFYNETQLNAHQLGSCKADGVVFEMPDPNEAVFQFTNVGNMLRKPYVCYADFESILEKIASPVPSSSTSYIMPFERHVPCGFSIVQVLHCCDCSDPRYNTSVVYRGADCLQVFFHTILRLAREFGERLDNRTTYVHMTDLDDAIHELTEECYLCKQSRSGREVVRDHCHICGQYRGAAHTECNLQLSLRREFPMVLHNLRRYDSHLIMQGAGKFAQENGILLTCIAKGTEDYISFTFRIPQFNMCVKFLDSMLFLPASLASLVDNLKNSDPLQFKALSHRFPNPRQQELLLRKGIYPYTYVDSVDRFKETSLPPRDKFFNSLTQETVSAEDYAHATTVWNEFQLRSLGDLHDLYVLGDTLQLTDVFENFRQFSTENFRLDPCNYVTMPSLSMDACLLMSGAKLDLLTDYDMYSFFEKGICGGVTVISERYARANNVLVPDYDPNQLTSWLFDIDANNLYGWGMNEPQPMSDFKDLTRDEIDRIDVRQIPDDSPIGYVLEVDLDYPEHLHDKHNDYPLAPEKMKVTPDMLSPYCRALREKFQLNAAPAEKLVPNLYHKRNYIVHYRTLKLYLQHEMELIHVHRVISFTQGRWIQPYVAFNTRMRQQATSDVAKSLYKLFNNVIYGKTIENTRNRVDVHLVTEPDNFRKLAAKPNFERADIFDPQLVAVQMRKLLFHLNKPIFVGFCILELAKLNMYDFHYNFIKAKYGPRASLLFTDTDSLCYSIQTESLYDDLAEHVEELLDTSDYPPTHFLHSNTNKKVMGKFSDETKGVPIVEFVGLAPKMYSMRCLNEDKKRAKGVSRRVVDKQLVHEDFLFTLASQSRRRDIMYRIQSDKHQLSTVRLNKISLTAYDDKRYILPDGVHTLAYGHCRIAQLENV